MIEDDKISVGKETIFVCLVLPHKFHQCHETFSEFTLSVKMIIGVSHSYIFYTQTQICMTSYINTIYKLVIYLITYRSKALVFKPKLLLLYLKFLDCIKGKGWHIEVFGTSIWRSVLNICLAEAQKANLSM